MTIDPRKAYLDAAVSTAGSDRLLIMLLSRLELDVRRAMDAQRAGDQPAAHRQLLHAQDIVLELRSTLDVDAWTGAAALGALYDWLAMRLVRANLERDVAITETCLSLVEGLTSTWSEAAALAATVSV